MHTYIHKYIYALSAWAEAKANLNKASTDAGTSCIPGVSNNGMVVFGIAIMVFLSLSLSLCIDNRSARSSVRILIMFLVRAEGRECTEKM